MLQHLQNDKETTPSWLANYQSGDNISLEDFCSGRIAFYPGCGTDGHLVEIGNRSQSVHCFIYTDYSVSIDMVKDTLNSRHGIKGYHILGTTEWDPKALETPKPYRNRFAIDSGKPYCLVVVFERDTDYSPVWGSDRFAVAFMNIDGFAVYKNLFVERLHKAPYIFLLEDYGYGLNYDRFGRGGILDRIMRKSGIWPKYAVSGHAQLWNGYQRIPLQTETKGGMHSFSRALYAYKGIGI